MKLRSGLIAAFLITLSSCEKREEQPAISPPSDSKKNGSAVSSQAHREPSDNSKPEQGDLEHNVRKLLPQALSQDQRHQLKQAYFELANNRFDDALELLSEFRPGVNRSAALEVLQDLIDSGDGDLKPLIRNLLEHGFLEDWHTISTLLQKHDSKLSQDTVTGWLAMAETKEAKSALAASLARVVMRGGDLAAALGSPTVTSFDQETNAEVRKYLYLVCATKFPDAAINYIEGSAADAELDRGFLTSTVNTIANERPEMAKDWVWHQAGRLKRPELVGTLTRFILQVDPIATSEWVKALTPGPLKDQAVKQVVEYCYSNKEYDDAKAWLPALTDSKLKDDLTTAFGVPPTANR